MIVSITTSVHPTEDPERVLAAVRNLFPDAAEAAHGTDGRRSFTASEIDTLATRICEQMIRDTARVLLLRSIRGNEIKFHLNKQAAFSRKVNFTEGRSVMGDITVRITADDPDKIARMIAGGSGL